MALVPPGTGNDQVVPDFVGAVSGQNCTLNRIWLPDQITMPDGSTWLYTNRASYPWVLLNGGQGSSPLSNSANALPQIKAAITAGKLPPCIVFFPSGEDADDNIAGWGQNCADGSFRQQDLFRFDYRTFLLANTRASGIVNASAMVGFSRGGFETMCTRARFGRAAYGRYGVLGAPRLDADWSLGSTQVNAATFGEVWQAGEKLKIWNNTASLCQAGSPISSLAGTGIFNVLGAGAGGNGAAPLLVLRSTGDTTVNTSMDNAINTRLPALGVAFDTYNLAGNPTHVMADYFTAWGLEPGALGFKWLGDAFRAAMSSSDSRTAGRSARGRSRRR